MESSENTVSEISIGDGESTGSEAYTRSRRKDSAAEQDARAEFRRRAAEIQTARLHHYGRQVREARHHNRMGLEGDPDRSALERAQALLEESKQELLIATWPAYHRILVAEANGTPTPAAELLDILRRTERTPEQFSADVGTMRKRLRAAADLFRAAESGSRLEELQAKRDALVAERQAAVDRIDAELREIAIEAQPLQHYFGLRETAQKVLTESSIDPGVARDLEEAKSRLKAAHAEIGRLTIAGDVRVVGSLANRLKRLRAGLSANPPAEVRAQVEALETQLAALDAQLAQARAEYEQADRDAESARAAMLAP